MKNNKEKENKQKKENENNKNEKKVIYLPLRPGAAASVSAALDHLEDFSETRKKKEI